MVSLLYFLVQTQCDSQLQPSLRQEQISIWHRLYHHLLLQQWPTAYHLKLFSDLSSCLVAFAENRVPLSPPPVLRHSFHCKNCAWIHQPMPLKIIPIIIILVPILDAVGALHLLFPLHGQQQMSNFEYPKLSLIAYYCYCCPDLKLSKFKKGEVWLSSRLTD